MLRRQRNIADPVDCSKQKTCADCQRVGPNCGWCDDGSETGLGRCLLGSLEAPIDESLCPNDGKSEWYFTNCSGMLKSGCLVYKRSMSGGPEFQT